MHRAKPGSWVLMILPKRSLLLQFVAVLRPALSSLGVSVERPNVGEPIVVTDRKVVRLMTPELLVRASSQPGWSQALKSLRLVVCENLELLDAEYELAVSLMLHGTQRLPVRFVGLAASLTDASDLADWLHVSPSLMCCFRPSDREQDLKTIVHSFTIPHSASLFKSMAKPAHAAISSSAGEAALVFVPSHAQCRSVANDLITQCAIDLKMQGYLPSHLSAENLEPYLARLQDYTLADIIARGIGIYHDSVSKSDRALILELYAEGIIRTLVLAREALWALPLRAATVISMGTQYVRMEGEKGDRQVKDYALPEIIHMQGRAARNGQSGRYYLFCQSESQETMTRFLNDGLPVESTLHSTPALKRWLHDRWKSGMISDKQQTLDILSWTYLARRMASNPMYYDAVPEAVDETLSRMTDSLHSIDSTYRQVVH